MSGGWILFPKANSHFHDFVRPTRNFFYHCQMVLFKISSSTCVGFISYIIQWLWQEDAFTRSVIQSTVDFLRLQTSAEKACRTYGIWYRVLAPYKHHIKQLRNGTHTLHPLGNNFFVFTLDVLAVSSYHQLIILYLKIVIASSDVLNSSRSPATNHTLLKMGINSWYASGLEI